MIGMKFIFAVTTAGLFMVTGLLYANGSAVSPGFTDDQRYTASERAGRDIWFNATANNGRFFTYSYQQRIGAAVDWYRVLRADNHNERFQAWGIINDPDCCIPGEAGCKATSLQQTYGFEYCPGDEDLLKYVGKTGYRDPACDFVDAPFDITTPHGDKDQREDSCALNFGTSTGALGFRKFPNPRFDIDRWIKINGSLASWENLGKFISDDPDNPDSRKNHLFDASVEPPFLIGMACGACHIAFIPSRPPQDTANPEWENIDGLVGNQYSRVSEILASGLHPQTLEFQLLGRARPGTADTSALPMDLVANPGTMNAIINFAQRPLHNHLIEKWHKTDNCNAQNDEKQCWCEPEKTGKCWQWKETEEQVQNILKGGEDSIGLQEAIQRVYFNIGSCAEQCWINHIPDLRAVDPVQRNYGQTPFVIGQCRRDCASARAIEDRLPDLAGFLLTGRPHDLYRARGYDEPRDLEVALDKEYGEGSVDRGRQLFATNCASCHSSQPAPFDNTDFLAQSNNDAGLREDWLGNDRVQAASEIGTQPARSLHSNHMKSRVWEQFGSKTLRDRAADPQRKEVMKAGGRGYYRNISLLSVWAHAPFMHNNAIGPEICGKPVEPRDQFYSSPYVKTAATSETPDCIPYDPGIEGRLALYKASMEALLNPALRIPKITVLDRPMILDVAPKIQLGDIETGLSFTVPKGVHAATMSNLRFKDLLQDIVLLKTGETKALRDKYKTLLNSEEIEELIDGLGPYLKQFVKNRGLQNSDALTADNSLVQRFYSNNFTRVENSGHRFGEDLSAKDKQALIAFMTTL